jgi:sigma-B regulation protein RsbU (phosphoserine phosphatase)
METNLSLTNESFSFLENSSEFLNKILEQIDACVLLLDKNLCLKAFNNAATTIFSNKRDESLLYRKCGEVIGCAYQIEEQKECGQTSHCKNCDLRISALTSYMNDEPIFKEYIARPFYNFNNEKIEKHLQFSTRLFIFNNEKYIIMIVSDISNFVELEKKYHPN